jgi:predicted nucleic acid-binding protein
VDELPQRAVVLPVQVLGELFQVLVRKAGRSAKDARSAILGWRNAFALMETSPATLLAVSQFSIWDAIILCAAAEADCRLLLSEDMQDEFVWKGITIVNPFAKSKHPLLEALLNQQT